MGPWELGPEPPSLWWLVVGEGEGETEPRGGGIAHMPYVTSELTAAPARDDGRRAGGGLWGEGGPGARSGGGCRPARGCRAGGAGLGPCEGSGRKQELGAVARPGRGCRVWQDPPCLPPPPSQMLTGP